MILWFFLQLYWISFSGNLEWFLQYSYLLNLHNIKLSPPRHVSCLNLIVFALVGEDNLQQHSVSSFKPPFLNSLYLSVSEDHQVLLQQCFYLFFVNSTRHSSSVFGWMWNSIAENNFMTKLGLLRDRYNWHLTQRLYKEGRWDDWVGLRRALKLIVRKFKFSHLLPKGDKGLALLILADSKFKSRELVRVKHKWFPLLFIVVPEGGRWRNEVVLHNESLYLLLGEGRGQSLEKEE